MNKNKKGMALVAVALLLAAALFVGAAAAANVNVAEMDGHQYQTLEEAVYAVPDNGTEKTITMIADYTIEGNYGVEIEPGKNIILNLNGHTVKNMVNDDDESYVIFNMGTLTITDSVGGGKLMNALESGVHPGDVGNGTMDEPQYNYATDVIQNCGTLTVEKGLIEQTAAGDLCFAIDAITPMEQNVITKIAGGEIRNNNHTALRQYANSDEKKNDLIITGGSIEGGHSGVWVQLAGQWIDSAGPKKMAYLNISDGTVKGGTYAVYDSHFGNDTYDQVQYAISGGKFYGPVSFEEKRGFITGGTFNVDPSNYVKSGLVWDKVTSKVGTPQAPAAKTPVPFIGILAGLGAAAVIFGMRRR